MRSDGFWWDCEDGGTRTCQPGVGCWGKRGDRVWVRSEQLEREPHPMKWKGLGRVGFILKISDKNYKKKESFYFLLYLKMLLDFRHLKKIAIQESYGG